MDRLFIIMPAYNEQANIEKVVDQWYPLVERFGTDSRMVVIDDGSKDETYRTLCSLAESRPALIPITKPNAGHGATVMYGYRYALDEGADYVFQTDSDGQTDPSSFPLFWQLRDTYDMVIGARQDRGDGASRLVVTKVLKQVVALKFHVSLRDANAPYRLMAADVLRENLAFIPPDFNLANVALCAAYAKFGCSIKYLPITFKQRQGGVNSIDIPAIIEIGKKALADFSAIDATLNAEVARRKGESEDSPA